MPSYIDPKFVHVEPRGKGGAVAGALVAAAVAFGVVEIVTSAAFAIAVYVAVGVVAALCIAGVALAVRELRHPSWGPLWRGESESLLRQALRHRPAAGEPVVAAVPQKAPPRALPARAPLAIEGARPVIAVIPDVAQAVRDRQGGHDAA
jgi:hypothetical protein